MATTFSNSSNLVYDVSTTARAQAFCQFIVDTLTAAGWVQTSDTGQLVVSSIASGFTTANVKSGYQVWRMDDALQSTKPIYVRFDFGTGSNANAPGLWITVGSGSNGSGTITNIIFNGGAASSSTVRSQASDTTSPVNSYGAGDESAVRVLMYAASKQLMFSLTRTVDDTGAYNDDGVCLAYCENASGTLALSKSIVCPHPGGGAAPTAEVGITTVLSNLASSGYGADVGVGLVIYFLGRAMQPPGDIVVVNSGDYAAEASFPMTVYGTSRTYQLGSVSSNPIAIPGGGGGNIQFRASTRVGIRYD